MNSLPLDKMDCVILCGGKGSRLGDLTKKNPKPLLPVGDHPFLFYLLRQLQQEGFKKFILAAHYLADQFYEFKKDHRGIFPNVEVVIEKEPLGTGGALRHAADFVSSKTFAVFNGDSLIFQPVLPVLKWHRDKKSFFTLIAIRAQNVRGALHNKGGLEIDSSGVIKKFRGHQTQEEQWINGGQYICEREKILTWPRGRYDLEVTLDSLLSPDKGLAFRSQAPLIDIGMPQCLELARQLLAKQSKFKEQNL